MNSKSSPKRFIVLGDAGAGKSSFINFLYNYFHGSRIPKEIFCPDPQVKIAIPCANWVDYLDEKYKNNISESNIDDQTKSQTQLCTRYKIVGKTIYLEIIDTPGFNDTNGADMDEKNLAMIETALKGVNFISGIIMVVNGSIPRLGVVFKNFLHMLHQVWPNDLLNNCVAILTNCDETSVNLDSSVLEHYLNIDNSKKFYFQNSLFRWDPKNQSSKTMHRLHQNFEDNLETTKSLIDKLLAFNDVPTKSFEVGGIKIILIENCIFQSIQQMVDLIGTYTEQQIAQASIQGAQDMMKNNQEWEKHREINAIRWVGVPRRHQLPPLPAYYRHSNQFPLSERERISAEDQTLCTPRFHDDTDMQSNYPSYSKQLSSEYHSKNTQHGRNMKNMPLAGENEQLRGSQTSENPYSDQESTAGSPSRKVSRSSQATATSNDINSVYPDGRYSGQRPHENQSVGNQQRVGKSPGFFRRCFSGGDHQSRYSPISDGMVYHQEQTKIQVILPDNEAQSHHQHAQQQASRLKERSDNLVTEQQELKKSMTELLEQLKKQVAELRAINKNYDIIERNRDLLCIFKDTIGCISDDPAMLRYYHETVDILSKKSK